LAAIAQSERLLRPGSLPSLATRSTITFVPKRDTVGSRWRCCAAEPAAILSPSVIRNETRAELLAAVPRLEDRERDLIALKFAAGLTNRRIAEITGLSESNVGVILYRAVRRLRAELNAKEGDHE
jgi:DNA-directed RNA polymerase specialized sigma24 family protein